MKNTVAIFFLISISFSLFSQEIRVVNNDTLFRLEKIIVRQYDGFSDTLVIDRFPPYWMDSTEARAYLAAEIEGSENRFRRDSLKAAKELSDASKRIAAFNNAFGDSAYQKQKKVKIALEVEGLWSFEEKPKNGQAVTNEYNFTGGKIMLLGVEVGSYTFVKKHTISVTTPTVQDLQMKSDEGNVYTGKKGNVDYILSRL